MRSREVANLKMIKIICNGGTRKIETKNDESININIISLFLCNKLAIYLFVNIKTFKITLQSYADTKSIFNS